MVVSFEVTRRRKSPKLCRRSKASRDAPTIGIFDIKQGSFVGVTAMPRADGSDSAPEVHIFPEAMRGTGEGHYPWDLGLCREP
jgi:hypothetical protein